MRRMERWSSTSTSAFEGYLASGVEFELARHLTLQFAFPAICKSAVSHGLVEYDHFCRATLPPYLTHEARQFWIILMGQAGKNFMNRLHKIA